MMNNKIAIGTAQIGMDYGIANNFGKPGLDQVKEIFNIARDNNIDTFDTAVNYGDSETIIGIMGLDQSKVITKLPSFDGRKEEINEWLNQRLNKSLDHLQVDSIFGLLLHNPKDLLNKGIAQELIDGLNHFREEGRVKKIGVSIYSPDELEELIGNFQIDIIQVPLNIMDRRLITSGWLGRLKSLGVEIHVRSIFLQGLLLMKQEDLPNQFMKWSSHFRKWYSWLDDQKISPLDACLNYVMSIKDIDKVVIGIDNAMQLKQICMIKNENDFNFPDYLMSQDEMLINPSNWS